MWLLTRRRSIGCIQMSRWSCWRTSDRADHNRSIVCFRSSIRFRVEFLNFYRLVSSAPPPSWVRRTPFLHRAVCTFCWQLNLIFPTVESPSTQHTHSHNSRRKKQISSRLLFFLLFFLLFLLLVVSVRAHTLTPTSLTHTHNHFRFVWFSIQFGVASWNRTHQMVLNVCGVVWIRVCFLFLRFFFLSIFRWNSSSRRYFLLFVCYRRSPFHDFFFSSHAEYKRCTHFETVPNYCKLFEYKNFIRQNGFVWIVFGCQ